MRRLFPGSGDVYRGVRGAAVLPALSIGRPRVQDAAGRRSGEAGLSVEFNDSACACFGARGASADDERRSGAETAFAGTAAVL